MGKFRIAAPQDFAGGLFLITIGLGAYWASSNLGMGTLRAMGPGMLPKSLSVIVAGLGVILTLTSLKAEGPDLDRWSIRGLVFVIAGACAFALTIRGMDLPGGFKLPAIGLIAAGPLVAIVSAFASPETKWGEVLIFAAVMTTLCAGLFKYALGLPIPLAPWLLGY
ncbi:MAG: tripartite tricarboxylate transporter TctB family protein [Bosea sp. (in: a-proteobacteria)]